MRNPPEFVLIKQWYIVFPTSVRYGAPPGSAPPGAYGAPPPGATGAPPSSGYGAPPGGAPPNSYAPPGNSGPPPGAYGAPAGYGAPPPVQVWVNFQHVEFLCVGRKRTYFPSRDLSSLPVVVNRLHRVHLKRPTELHLDRFVRVMLVLPCSGPFFFPFHFSCHPPFSLVALPRCVLCVYAHQQTSNINGLHGFILTNVTNPSNRHLRTLRLLHRPGEEPLLAAHHP